MAADIVRCDGAGALFRGSLGKPDDENTLRETLAALHQEVASQIEKLEERRRRLEDLLAQDDKDVSIERAEEPYAIRLAEKHLGEHLSEISTGLWEQERRLWSTLDAFEWPKGYTEMQEFITFYYAERPDEYRQMLRISERLASLADLPADSQEVEEVAKDLAQHLQQTPFPEGPPEDSPLTSGAVGEVFAEVLQSNFSPAQLRAVKLVYKHFEGQREP